VVACAQAHRLAAPRTLVDKAGHGGLRRARKGEAGRLGHGDDGGVSEHRGTIRGQVNAGAVLDRDQQHERWDTDRAQLQPVLKALDEGDSLHPAHRDVAAHDHAERCRANPVGDAEHPLQRDASALHLRQQVEPADDQDERGRRLAQTARPQSADREIGDRVRAEAAQRRRHQQ
jgi:hypothetical protein